MAAKTSRARSRELPCDPPRLSPCRRRACCRGRDRSRYRCAHHDPRPPSVFLGARDRARLRAPPRAKRSADRSLDPLRRVRGTPPRASSKATPSSPSSSRRPEGPALITIVCADGDHQLADDSDHERVIVLPAQARAIDVALVFEPRHSYLRRARAAHRLGAVAIDRIWREGLLPRSSALNLRWLGGRLAPELDTIEGRLARPIAARKLLTIARHDPREHVVRLASSK